MGKELPYRSAEVRRRSHRFLQHRYLWFFIILIVGTLFGGQLKAVAGKIFKKKAAK